MRAQSLLEARFGASAEAVQAALAHSSAEVLAEHTRYSDGFALLMPLAQGVAVALRRAEATRMAFESDPPPEAERAVARIMACAGAPVEAAVVSDAPLGPEDAAWPALGVAAWRAARALGERAGSAVPLSAVQQLLEEEGGYPLSAATAIAAGAGAPGTLLLVDTATEEHLPVEEPGAVGWGFLTDAAAEPAQPTGFARARRAETEEALERLRAAGFGRLAAFRDLEHRDLGRALDAVPERLRPVVRHLVTENRRVPRLVAAARNGDGQMLGALLLMSHASRRDVWHDITPETDFAVRQAERLSLEGVYGARAAGCGGVLVAARPHVLPASLRRIAAAFEERFGRPLHPMVL